MTHIQNSINGNLFGLTEVESRETGLFNTPGRNRSDVSHHDGVGFVRLNVSV